MKENSKNNNNGLGKLVNKLAAEKKKSIIAFCLIAIMAFMWIRVIGGKTPQAGEAAVLANTATVEEKGEPELKVFFVELPNVKGRNDMLTRDFFVAGGLGFGIEEVNVASGGSEEKVRRIAGQLKLEAIDSGKNPQAFINDVLLKVGDKLSVKDGKSVYECEVIRIEKEMVVIRCGDSEITLKIEQASVAND
ncbi:MAG: hypothetical protein NTW55_07760 [Planctomycetota bacterium]|nr:hypothetical protein [Planctomycetota bacterium]